MKTLTARLAQSTALCLFATAAYAALVEDNSYTQKNFVANKAKYSAALATDARFINAWGIATRPAGAGGHFWVLAKDISYQYVGDVTQSDDLKLRTLHVDDVPEVKLPIGGEDAFATGVAFLGSQDDFVITQEVEGKPAITAAAKFLFASDGGIISAWTERKNSDGTFDRPAEAKAVIDQSAEGAQFFGITTNAVYDRLYAADFGAQPAVKVFNGKFESMAIKFDQPFDENNNGRVDPGEYAPFNVQGLTTPAGTYHLFVTYAKTQPCPAEEIGKACQEGELFVGEEDTSAPGMGRMAEFDDDGKLIAVWNDGGKLSAPWGMAYAPEQGFGALSGTLLVANFGDGTIAGYDPKTREFVDVMRDASGKPVEIDKIWGIIFGNGASLGDKDALYFAAGPEDEVDGVFGSLRYTGK